MEEMDEVDKNHEIHLKLQYVMLYEVGQVSSLQKKYYTSSLYKGRSC